MVLKPSDLSGPARAHHHHGPEKNLQLEAGYIYADCTSSRRISLAVRRRTIHLQQLQQPSLAGRAYTQRHPERRRPVSINAKAGLGLPSGRNTTGEGLNGRVFVVPDVKQGIQSSDPQQVSYPWDRVHQLKFTALLLHRG
jgi:hypothetical protein